MSDLSLPEYRKIANKITQRIHNGLYPSKSYLPSENKLAKEFKVTRVTVRKALNILKNLGTIESFQGKGYRVGSLYWEQSLLKFYSFGRDIADKLQKAKTKLITFQVITGLKDIEVFNMVKLNMITRLRIVDEIPLILETSYIPLKFLPNINKSELEQSSLYDLLEENKIHLVKAKEYLEPIFPSVEVQKLLKIGPDIPLFQTIRYTYNSKHYLIELRKSLIRGDHFRFSVEMTL